MRPRGMMQPTQPKKTNKNPAKAIFQDFSWCQPGSESDIAGRLSHYIELPGILGCQTKMVMGYLCGDKVEITPEFVREAKRRIRDEFLFVGISKPYFQDSIALLHERFKDEYGDQPLRPPEIHTVRKSTRSSNVDEARKFLQSVGFDDPYDREIYNEAFAIFSSQYRTYFGKDVTLTL